ncbi:MAG: NAD(P)-dependent oxidoreductase [Chitinophagaceae bacterium]
MQRIAVLGLGNMGRGIALSLLRSGKTVIVWNRSKEKAGSVIQEGAQWAESAVAAVKDADAVIAMVADDIASDEIWLGKHKVLDSLQQGVFVIECSTLSMNHVKRLSGEAIKRKLVYIDCPVTGIPEVAATGQLTLLVGAMKQNFEKALPLLQSFSKSVRYFGGIGTGTGYKLMINLMGAVQIAALAEGIVMAEKLGLDMETVAATIETSAAASPQVVRYVRRMAEKNFLQDPAFTIGLRYKDADYAMQLAGEIQMNAKLGATAKSWFADALSEYKNSDEATIVDVVEKNDNKKESKVSTKR